MSAGKATYIDSSALVKLAIEEPESAALGSYLRRRSVRVSSALARVEVSRALAQTGAADIQKRARATLGGMELIGITNRILERAASVAPPNLRALDAIHLATALQIQPDIGTFVTYDARLTMAAAALGFKVAQPR